MAGKFFYLYLIGGTVALALLVYSIIAAYPDFNRGGAFFYVIPTLLLYYMAYKTWHVKNDGELM
ncbi:MULTISPECIES: hypothetical protein [Mucilaginibacter]|uniref:hypothetical protein n=1 Tax=Mucilaginibacter TaxID=423349 RepID=UPI002091A83F|nr:MULTISPECIES: hypothetical protein [Mucilaginibacter]MEB0249110.1 hypothetical protein [Mucilaginibacter sp. 5B2]MCO5936357.1 hypothetical protein [Mucilaginibacter aurantiaciroseus]MEB0263493.1 hypothetical protein [Mucilaginibacter sp. 10I4]MEB0277078.1 hypothetical protein [Mucilaginibacter sp. 10B2]MEB0301854.1 hypothetical protein [Mucilaginibacter sp. 5C4]